MRTLRSVSPSRRGVPTAGGGKGGPRSFTDDRGQTVSRPEMPRRTAAFTGTAALRPEDPAAEPSRNEPPAVRACRIAPRPDEPHFSHAGAAPLGEPPARAVEQAKKVV